LFVEWADEPVERIARGPPLALESLSYLMEPGGDWSIEEALHNEDFGMAAVTGSDDNAEAVDAFLEDWEPTFGR
jgi:enoyl-CoA hydratase/carnithine racemase